MRRNWTWAALPLVLTGLALFFVPGWRTEARSAVFVGVMLLLSLEFVVIGLLINGRPAGAFIDNRNKLSLSKLQAGAWTVMVLAAFATAAAFNAVAPGTVYTTVAKRGYGDIEVNVTGGYDPTQTDENSSLVKSMEAVYRAERIPCSLSPRLAGSWPGYVFTGAPVSLPAGHFGLGHGGRQHAPDEYLVIEPENSNLRSFDAATLGYVELLYALAQT